MSPTDSHKIDIDQSRAKLALAVMAHLRQIERTAILDNKFRRPLEMDQGDLLLCAASLRALFFDDSRAAPMLRTLLGEAFDDLQIEAMESDLGLVLLSELVPDDRHVSDAFVHFLLHPESKEEHPLDAEFEMFYGFMDRAPFEDLLRNPETWVPKISDDVMGPTHLSGGPTQLAHVCRRRQSLAEWGRVRVGVLKTISIDRRTLITYVANQLGGVHYDSRRHPRTGPDAEQFKVLASAYDWDNQAITHAGLVAVGVACVEVLASDLAPLLSELVRFHDQRQSRLRELRVKRPVDEPDVSP